MRLKSMVAAKKQMEDRRHRMFLRWNLVRVDPHLPSVSAVERAGNAAEDANSWPAIGAAKLTEHAVSRNAERGDGPCKSGAVEEAGNTAEDARSS